MTKHGTDSLLTNREHTILVLIADGLSNKEIADHLTITLHTVKWYIKQVFRKLEVSRRTEAVATAQKLGLLEPQTPIHDIGVGIPTPITPFVGRKQELDAIQILLNDYDTRLVTILGAGGIGKTRLAITYALQQQRKEPGSVCFVSLESLSEANHLVAAITRTLGLQFSDQLDPHQQLLDHLRRRRLLIVLDNFEHLLEAGMYIRDILATALNVKILTTSREKLNLQGETIFTLKGLSYSTEPENLTEQSAVQLFNQTARRIRTSFQIDLENTKYINQICKLVDGMPLAIELASAWVDVLSPKQIIDKIEESLEILQAKSHDLPLRHRSIQAIFEHSWSMLTQQEQTVLGKLSVFHGGFDSDSAENITGTSLINLSRLMDKSFVIRSTDDRLHLHPLVRKFAREKLTNNPEQLNQTLDHHSTYFANIAHEFETIAKSHPQSLLNVYANRQLDIDNILAGWRWAVKQWAFKDIDRYIYGLSLMAELGGFQQTIVQEFGSILRHLTTDVASVNTWLIIRLKTHYGWCLGAMKRFEEAIKVLTSAHEDMSELDNIEPADGGQLYNFTGWMFQMNGQSTHAHDYLTKSLHYCRQSNFVWFECVNNIQLGSISASNGDIVSAISHYEEAFQIAEKDEIMIGLLYILPIAGYIRCMFNDLEVAQTMFHRTLILNQKLTVTTSILLTVTGITALYGSLGKQDIAVELLAIVLHHPQIGSATLNVANNLRNRFETMFTDKYVNMVMEKAKYGELSGQYIDNEFAIDSRLVNQLLDLLQDAKKLSAS